jgi:hypothetical protein
MENRIIKKGIKMKKINFNELFKKIGKFTSIPFIFAFIGALGGSKNSSKAIRRFGIPAIILVLAFIKAKFLWPKNIIFILIMLESFVLSIGYGIPCVGDNGSKLGRFYYNLFKQSEIWANIFTRGTIGLIFCLPLYVIPYLFHNWTSYLVGCLIIMFGYTTISWRDLGRIRMGEYDLCNSDNINYGLMGYAVYLMIFTCL